MITARQSKKRGLVIGENGGESSSSMMIMDLDNDDEDVIEIPPPAVFSSPKKASKQKEVMHYDVIDVDDYEDSDDIFMLSGFEWVDMRPNGKNSPAPSQNPGGAAAGTLKTPQSKPGPPPIVYEHYPELDPYGCYDHEIAMMQAHFDSLDTPTGVEVSIPWWPYPAISETDVSAKMSSSSCLQFCDKPGSGESNNFQTPKFTQRMQTVSSSPKPFNSSFKRATSSSSSQNGVHPKCNGGASHMVTNPVNYGVPFHSAALSGNSLSPGNDAFSQSLVPWNFYQNIAPMLPVPPFTQLSKTQLSQTSTINKLGIPHGSSASFSPSYKVHKAVAGSGLTSSSNVNPFIQDPNYFYKTVAGSGLTSDNPLIKTHTNMSAKDSIPVDFVFRSNGDGNEIDLLKKLDAFKRFDIVEDHSDHYYSTKANGSTQLSKKSVKTIQEEWKILEKDLPDTIFVRVYETRMDLLRAVIMGAEGTPYHDGIFFFDVLFPSDYPNKPPLVYYHSGGLRLNPNLYNCGKVCLSLLNTWHGDKDEKWKPGYSTILQVLVSIQGLVLNSKPYFNEPGYAHSNGTLSGEKLSDQYNENTFLLSLKTMLYAMRRCPKSKLIQCLVPMGSFFFFCILRLSVSLKHFEDFVYGHFFKHAHKILEACQAYKNGVQVGRTVNDGSGGAPKPSSTYCFQTLKMSLPGHVKPLVEAFTKIGVKDCDKYFSQDN
ncbi:putative ubiquitin-conjugating enzyme E2 25 [Drosera capensis]